MDVVLVRWPSEEDRRSELRDEGDNDCAGRAHRGACCVVEAARDAPAAADQPADGVGQRAAGQLRVRPRELDLSEIVRALSAVDAGRVLPGQTSMMSLE